MVSDDTGHATIDFRGLTGIHRFERKELEPPSVRNLTMNHNKMEGFKVMRQLAFKLKRELGGHTQRRIFHYIDYSIIGKRKLTLIFCGRCDRLNVFYKGYDYFEYGTVCRDCRWIDHLRDKDLREARMSRDDWAEKYRKIFTHKNFNPRMFR